MASPDSIWHLVNLLSCFFLTGLIWFVAVVHYPLFAAVGESDFQQYERKHAQRTTSITFPTMTAELLSGFVLVWWHWEGGIPWLWVAMLGLIGAIWIITVFLAVPLHGQLAAGFDAEIHRKLLRVNWWRTAAWTVRSGIWVWILVGN